jgi:hypothetical protein
MSHAKNLHSLKLVWISKEQTITINNENFEKNILIMHVTC